MGKRILIIEDDPAIRDYAVETLRAKGYEVAEAADGKEGVKKARAFRPDVVVLDLMLPRMHGFEVARQIREDKELNGVRIVVTSSKGYDTDVASAQDAGADAYLRKPYKSKDLLHTVRELLGSGPKGGGSGEDKDEMTTDVESVSDPEPRAVPSTKTEVSVTFWGTRGSCPSPGPDTVRYGGNTPCVELRVGETLIVIDCGSGMRALGQKLMGEFKDKPVIGHIFVGHTHWDHIQGFPFFVPLYIPKNHFTVYSVSGAGKSLERVFKGQMAGEYFPVPLKSLSGQLDFVQLDGPLTIGSVEVKYHHLNHPGVAIGFRFEAHGKSVTYLSDHESFVRFGGPSEVTRKQDQGIVEFASGSDLLICEAQYTEEEYKCKRGWGHSTFHDAVDRGIASGSKRLMIFHHDPTHLDDQMDELVEDCRDRVRKIGSSIECAAAKEGDTVVI